MNGVATVIREAVVEGETDDETTGTEAVDLGFVEVAVGAWVVRKITGIRTRAATTHGVQWATLRLMEPVDGRKAVAPHIHLYPCTWAFRPRKTS